MLGSWPERASQGVGPGQDRAGLGAGGWNPVPAQKQLRVVLALKVLLDEVRQQLLKQTRGVVEAALQGHHGKGSHSAPVTHGEAALGLQGVDEGEHEGAAVQQLPEETQGLLNMGGGLEATGRLREQR